MPFRFHESISRCRLWEERTPVRNFGPLAFHLLSVCALAQDLPGSAAGPNELTQATRTQAAEFRPLTISVARVIGSRLERSSPNESYSYPTAEIRLREIPRLSTKLLVQDQRALLNFVTGERPPEFEISVWRAVVNDVFDILLAQERVLPGLEVPLFKIAREARDSVLRDYAIQKLPKIVLVVHDPSVHRSALAHLIELATQPGVNEQGTALLAWKRLNTGKDADPLLVEAVRSCLESDIATTSSIIAALQMAVALHDPIAASKARRILESADCSVAVKLSALGALGRCGTPEDSSLIERFLQEPRYQIAAQAALKSLDSQP